MEKFFIVKNQSIIDQMKKYGEMSEKINEAYKVISEKYGIEANRYFPFSNVLKIVPTLSDSVKFKKDLKVSDYGEFKKKSEIAKSWVNMCKEKGIESPHKPNFELQLMIYPEACHFSNRLFFVGDKLYGSFQCNSEFTLDSEDFEELKPSEFYSQIGE